MKKIVSILVVGFVLTGCGFIGGNTATNPINPVTGPATDSISDKLAKEAGKKMAGELMGGVQIDYSDEGSGDVVAWPKEISSEVPVFKYGVIDATMLPPADVSDGSAVISFRDVEKGAYDKYRADLKAAGWEVVTDPEWTVEHVTAVKGKLSIDIDADYIGENTAALYLMVDTSADTSDSEPVE